MSISMEEFVTKGDGNYRVRDGQHHWHLTKVCRGNNIRISHSENGGPNLLSFIMYTRHGNLEINAVGIPGLAAGFQYNNFRPADFHSTLELMLLEKLATVFNVRVIHIKDARCTPCDGYFVSTTLMEYITHPNKLSYFAKRGYKSICSYEDCEALASMNVGDFLKQMTLKGQIFLNVELINRVRNRTIQDVISTQDVPRMVSLLLDLLGEFYFKGYKELRKERYDPSAANAKHFPGYF